ncbi:MAG: PEP-CTERM sorting domain-containing protein [Microcoleus sp. PH2017_10_PVI_O_A]|uniref:PEP-CTERM sorting domain-containing protein n=1 Tax=unclassified Microcoleus TaxID=2642155 RepID=UPI001D3D104C|nr:MULTISPECIES: PEP-CTERM sorting domain-containing protein [unclassified Microcoleus]TAE79238.1 MAG: PEP-CTERM sorting domain-containing protein [Oscillatoriales cyanobacterium]MCC3408452.1 PEP-CTERM sorting domain-containing protein [Microcoleus sp. PH2017_10_PVI_O_A]MCC3462547.1 PEP-CTERM sorting domain-containing protein [Microcoleus sp. PH2017_11_PCY_U_A]MCC3480959.1 PEP-CTERM sorting domain-containing protein [Microcoleus sp. PH2017_12_PCY_D_A]MCC3530405.1 PEP-CTERM sorting domain-conta
MKRFKTAILLGAATATIFFGSTAKQAARAETLNLGWDYAIDPSYDSLDSNGMGGITAGGTIYEIYGMAIKDDVSTNTIWIAINANLPLTGNPTEDTVNGYPVSNRNIGFGDLFFDFSDRNNFKAASDSNSLFGIRFAPNNDSNAPSTGVYSGVKAKSVVAQNAGWSNFYNHSVNGVLPLTGLEARTGDLGWNDSYYNPYTSEGSHSRPESLIPNVIESGNKVGDITMVGDAELVAAGFALNVIPAPSTSRNIGFKFDKSLLSIGSYVATLIQECNNDAIALKGETQPLSPPEAVPEPSSILATLLGFGAIAARRKRKQKLAV